MSQSILRSSSKENGAASNAAPPVLPGSEGVPEADTPLPRRRHVAAVGLFHVDVHMGSLAEIEVGTDADFPPAAC